MAFESLTDKLQNVFKNLRKKGRLTEADVKAALKEVKMALLEADVSFKVVKQFMKAVQERAVGQDVMSGLNPGQMVIKIVHEELVNNYCGKAGRKTEIQRKKAPSGGLRRLPPCCYQTASGKRRKTGCGRICHGRQKQPGRYSQGCLRTCQK